MCKTVIKAELLSAILELHFKKHNDAGVTKLNSLYPLCLFVAGGRKYRCQPLKIPAIKTAKTWIPAEN